MNVLLVTAFDDALSDYGLRMLRSAKRFNPNVELLYADFGDMTRLDELAKLGVKRMLPTRPVPRKHPRFRDMLLWAYVKQRRFNWLVWVDADTLILRPLDELWSDPGIDFVGHPDRTNDGIVDRCDFDLNRNACVPGDRWAKFASGVWATSSPALLHTCYNHVIAGEHGGRDSDVLTRVVNEGTFKYRQLDGNLWNFGRQIVPLAEYDGQGISYTLDGQTHRPYVVAFSRVPISGVDCRLTNPAIETFYNERVL